MQTYLGQLLIFHKSGNKRYGRKDPVPPHLHMREGRLIALMTVEQNFREWMEFRPDRSWPFRKRKSNGKIKHGG